MFSTNCYVWDSKKFCLPAQPENYSWLVSGAKDTEYNFLLADFGQPQSKIMSLARYIEVNIDAYYDAKSNRFTFMTIYTIHFVFSFENVLVKIIELVLCLT